MIKHARQLAPTLSGIREDHLNRYAFAADMINKLDLININVLDAGCGCGYGSYVIAKTTTDRVKITGFDIDRDAVAYGNEHYSHERIEREVSKLKIFDPSPFDVVVAFEILEHCHFSESFLNRAAQYCAHLICSVPNELATPYNPLKNKEHVRHYTPAEFAKLLDDSGWELTSEYSQQAKVGAGSIPSPSWRKKPTPITLIATAKSRLAK